MKVPFRFMSSWNLKYNTEHFYTYNAAASAFSAAAAVEFSSSSSFICMRNIYCVYRKSNSYNDLEWFLCLTYDVLAAMWSVWIKQQPKVQPPATRVLSPWQDTAVPLPTVSVSVHQKGQCQTSYPNCAPTVEDVSMFSLQLQIGQKIQFGSARTQNAQGRTN